MAFKRSEIRDILTKAGAPEEAVEEAVTAIFKLHIGVVDALKSENESLETKAKTAEKLKSQLEEAKTKLAEYDEADYKSKYEAEKANGEKIKTEYETFKTEQAKKAARAAKETAYRDILKDAGIPEKHYAKILKYSDVDSIELDENGKAKKAADILKSVKDEWGDHVETITRTGTTTTNPPPNMGGKAYKSKAEIMKITDAGERQAAIKTAIEAGSDEFK